MKDILPIKEAIYEMSLYFNQQQNDERITAYAKALSNYSSSQIIYAFKQVIHGGSAYFPSLAEILIHLKPKEASSDDVGNFVANEVIQKVIEFGIYRMKEALASMSEVSKQTIGDNLYILTEIANSDQDKLPTIRAQLRGMVKASTESIKANQSNEKLESMGIKTDNVLKMNNMKKLDYSKVLDKGDPA